jgi:hypothetical protein
VNELKLGVGIEDASYSEAMSDKDLIDMQEEK